MKRVCQLFEMLKVLHLNVHHNRSGEWLGLDLKTYLENDMCYKETRLHSQNPSTMLDTINRHNWEGPYMII